MLYAITFIAALAVAAVVGYFLIPRLRALKMGARIREIGPSWHSSKQGTPTMGGIMFICACLIAGIWVALQQGTKTWSYLYILIFSLIFGVIGFADDLIGVLKKRNLGLTEKQKLLLQIVVSGVYLFLLRGTGHLSSSLYIPFIQTEVQIPWIVYFLLGLFIMVGTVNAVNLTDGIDGLAASVTVPVMVFFTVAAIRQGSWESACFALAVCGGLLGFLIYNHHPAKVFMGDTGSLFLGGAVCALAYALDMPLILILVGIIYIAEALSDIIQVTYFKMTHGKRIFRMAPLHHHLEKGGWGEVKIVVVFTAITVVFCLLALLGVWNRVV